MLTTLANKTVTVLRPTLVEDHGNQIADWTTPTESDIPGCDVQPMGSDEILEHRDAVKDPQQLYAPPGSDILATDRVRHDGLVYEVFGEPRRWESASGALDYVEVVLSRWEG